MQLIRCVRAGILSLLLLELLYTLPWPWSDAPQEVPLHPSWVQPDESVEYNSTALLQRSHAAMQYNKSTQMYESPPLAIWFGADDLFYSHPSDGVATWLDLLATAKHPWSTYWIFSVAPQALRVMPEQTAQELSLLNAGLPVMRNIRHARPYFSQPERWVLQQFGWQPNDFLPEQFALCTAAVNENTLQPASTVTCSLHDTALTAAGQHSEEGSFVIRPDYPSTAAGVSPARISHARAAKTLPAGQRCPHAGPGLVLGPAGRWVAEVAQQWRPTAIAMRVLAQLWSIIVPTGSIARPQCGLFMQLHMLAYERPVNAFFVQTLVLVINVRNLLYLITVGYKISRRLALLAPAPLPVRLSGVALTLLGMFLGLWQSTFYTAVDAAFELLLGKAIVLGLSQCSLAAVVAWQLWAVFGLQLRTGCKAWQLAKMTFREARLLVLAPQALLVNNQALADRLPRRQVPAVGTWPAPLVIPEEVDELPVSEVPRGFICPITQAIMRQPALLLHDGTINPSTYDKESIAQWLAEHSTDPKNPGVQLCMKSVKLVYNGDLGRSIEDWVAAQLQRQQQQQQQHQTGLAAWRRALSGHLEGHHLPQDGAGAAAAAAEGVAAAAAGMFMHMRGNGGQGASPVAAAAEAASGGEGGDGGVLGGNADGQGAAAAAAAAAGAESGSILSGAGALMRTSSAAIAQVASMDLPAAAVAGLNRITTRALARRQHQRQPDADSIQEQQQQPLRQRQSEQQKGRSWRECDEADGKTDPDSSGTDSDRSDDVSSGSSSEVDSARQHSRTPPRSRVPRSQHRGSPAQGLPADGGVGGEGVGGVRRRQPRSGGQTAAAAAANRVEPAE